MKHAKMLISAVLLIALLCTLTGCIVVPVHDYCNDIDPASVASIEIYNLRNVNTLEGRFLETETPVRILQPLQHAAFLYDLSRIHFTTEILLLPIPSDPSRYYGDLTIRINFTDGSFQLVSDRSFGQSFDKDGKMVEYNYYACDSAEWQQFVQNYLNPVLPILPAPKTTP